MTDTEDYVEKAREQEARSKNEDEIVFRSMAKSESEDKI
jgi:hypothetical protein